MGLSDSVKSFFKRNKKGQFEDLEAGDVVEEGSVEFEYAKSPYDKYEAGHVFESGAINFDKATEPDMDDVNKEADDILAGKESSKTNIPSIQQVATQSQEKSDSELRQERIEELKQKGEIAALESKYTRTGQLKSELKSTAKDMLTGGKKTGTGRYSKDHDLTSAERVKKVVRNVSTLGGAVRISNLRKHFYVPKADTGFYVPTKAKKTTSDLYSSKGMQSLNMPASAVHVTTSSTLRRVGTPAYDKLRQASSFHRQQSQGMRLQSGIGQSPIAKLATSTPSNLAKPMKFVKVGSQAQDIAMERLRNLTFPTGLTTTEKLAYAEIKDNNDIDTKSHVVSELMGLGIDKLEASRAVEGLMHRRVVERGKTEYGESTLRIAK